MPADRRLLYQPWQEAAGRRCLAVLQQVWLIRRRVAEPAGCCLGDRSASWVETEQQKKSVEVNNELLDFVYSDFGRFAPLIYRTAAR